MERKVYTKYSNDRDERFNICTEIFVADDGSKSVVKRPYSQKGQKHINNLYRWCEAFEKKYQNSKLKINHCNRVEDGMKFPFVEGMGLDNVLDKFIEKEDMSSFINTINDYIKEITLVCEKKIFTVTDEFKEVFGDVMLPNDLFCSDITNIDLIFSNIIVQNDKWNAIDYEWTFDFPIPLNYVIYRALFFYSVQTDLRKQFHNSDFYSSFGITEEEISVYEVMEENLQKYVSGTYVPQRELYVNAGKKIFDVNHIVSYYQNQVHKYDFQVYYDYGAGFCEEQSSIFNIIPHTDGFIDFHMDVDNTVKRLRIDPGNHSCIAMLAKIDLMTDKGKKAAVDYETNGCEVKEGIIVYTTSDPQIYLNFHEQVIKSVKMLIRLEVGDEAIYQPIVEQANGLVQLKAEYANTLDALNTMKAAFDEKTIQYEKLQKEKSVEDIDFYETQQLLMQTQARAIELEGKVNQLVTSGSWKITKPLRVVRRVFQKALYNKATRLCGQGMRSLKRNGIKVTLRKVKGWNRKRKNKGNQIPIMMVGQNDFEIANTPELLVCNKKIAVHVHLYYEDLLEEFCNYLDNIPYQFDLFISCQEKADKSTIQKRAEKINHVGKVIVKACPNRGRDIAPLFVWFRDDIKKYDYLLHMHSKKSLYTGSEKAGWRQYSLDSLVGSESLVRKIFNIFEKEEGYGLVYPDNHEDVPMLAYSWLANEGEGRRLLDQLSIPFEGGIFTYPAGSFYWARMDAIMPLFDRRFTIEDFPEEAGQTDGTIAHAIERGIAFVAKNRNYGNAIVDFREGVIRKNTSCKAFRPYFNMNTEDAKEHLEGYDVISFDIFDTLITRCVIKPDDIFALLERKVETKYNVKLNYLDVRKRAEAKAWQKKQCFTNINDIYAELPEIAGISPEMAENFKQMEIDTEKELIIPRRDILAVFNHLKAKNKKIILVSDMYLTSDIVSDILSNCGYTGYDELYISCDCGYRKDNDTIWNVVLPKYAGKRFIHVGDNPRSDWQTLIDRKYEAMWIMNPMDAFKMSPCFDKLGKYLKSGIENSILLGMAMNGGLFNSPFAQTAYTGMPEVNDSWTLGYSVFGTILTNYIKKINDELEEDKTLLFLAREGYILQQMYETFMEETAQPMHKHHYFKTSRRSVTVAAIREDADIEKIIGQYYRGRLGNMLHARLGLDLFDGVEDKEIMMDQDLYENSDEVMKLLKPHKDEIYRQFDAERQNYLSYIDGIVSKEDLDKIEVIDVGYSGTIQYFLSKLLDVKVGGYYLATFKTKPDKIGCRCLAVYDENNSFIGVIQKTQLFLESVLQAPYGQLIKFDRENGELVARYKDDNEVGEQIQTLQDGILTYCSHFAKIIKDIYPTFRISENVVCDIYGELLQGKYISAQVASIFGVEDDYCSNKTLKFNRETDSWE